MESQFVNYKLEGTIATITMNDGGKNLISPQMLRELNSALDQAEKDQAVVIMTGTEGIFSAGFDLKTLKSGASAAYTMLMGGFKMSARLLAFPTPVVVACNGHAIAMGAFLLLSGDYRIGTAGPFKIVTNEVAIGLTMPATGIEVSRQRLAPAHFVRAVMLSETYSPETAVGAGFLDKVVPADALLQEAFEAATRFSELDMKAHYETKMRTRSDMLKALKRAIRFDRRDIVLQGLKRAINKSLGK